MKHSRAASLDAQIDTDTGEFSMVMATQGEASDGHILNIAGIETPDEMPLQLDHGRSSLANLGIVSNMRTDTIDGVPVLRGDGRIRLTGDGEALAQRRDIVDAISRGDLGGVSLTWESSKAKERRELPRNHPAHVARTESDPRKRFGLFFESSRAIEQSIVAIPADRGALIGRAETAQDDSLREVWRSLASRAVDTDTGRYLEIIDALELKVAELEERLQRDAAPASDDLPAEAPQLTSEVLQALIDEVRREQQAEDAALREMVSSTIAELTGRSL